MKTVTWDQLEAMLSGEGRFALEELGVTDDVARDIMMHEVADVVSDILAKHIQSDIYGAYSPKVLNWSPGARVPTGWKRLNDREIQYARRNSLNYGAIGMYKEMQGDELFITSDAEPNEPVAGSWSSRGHGGFLGLLEDGPSRVFSGVGPRPAISNAQAEIDDSHDIDDAFERGLKRHGISK